MNQVKKYREYCGLNQSELAQKSKLSQAAISQYEQQIRQPNGRSLVRLAIALQVDPGALIDNAAQKSQTLEEFDLSAISRAKAILDWWQANAAAVAGLEALSVKLYGESKYPLAILLKKLKNTSKNNVRN